MNVRPEDTGPTAVSQECDLRVGELKDFLVAVGLDTSGPNGAGGSTAAHDQAVAWAKKKVSRRETFPVSRSCQSTSSFFELLL